MMTTLKIRARWALRLGLAGMFLLTGGLKLRDVPAFATEIQNYQVLPWLAPWLAATLPTIETLLGSALILGPKSWARASALASIALLVVFTLAVRSVVVRGIDVTCGCFGKGSGQVTMLTVLRDVALVVAGAALYRLMGEPHEGNDWALNAA